MKGSIFRHPSPLPVGVSSGYVMTVLGPLPINEMGVTLMHEHILLDASGKWVPPCCCSDRHLAEMPVKMENLGGGETGGARRAHRRNRYLQPLYAG